MIKYVRGNGDRIKGLILRRRRNARAATMHEKKCSSSRALGQPNLKVAAAMHEPQCTRWLGLVHCGLLRLPQSTSRNPRAELHSTSWIAARGLQQMQCRNARSAMPQYKPFYPFPRKCCFGESKIYYDSSSLSCLPVLLSGESPLLIIFTNKSLVV